MPSAAAEQPVRLKLRGVEKQFRRKDGSTVKAVDGVDLDVREGEIIVLLGPSGCGKTTLLRSVAGLERPDVGHIEINGSPVFDSDRGLVVPPEKRNISMVFQSYALWPHMTVSQNVGYPLRMKRVARDEITSKVKQTLEMMRIGELGEQTPGAISGGQQQRVALARAVISDHEVILFDEPLSNVDAKVREHLRLEILAMQRELGFTALYVTHDQEEAMAIATKIAVIKEGDIVQLGTPQDVYHRPTSLYVARFVGSANELHGTATSSADALTVTTELGEITLPGDRRAMDGHDVVLVSRPERWSISADPSDGTLEWKGTVLAGAFIGSHNEYLVDVDGVRLQVWALGEDMIPSGSTVWVSINPGALLVMEDEG